MQPIKCERCGLTGEWIPTGASCSRVSAQGLYSQCPTITDRLDRGKQTDAPELHCPDFYAATVRAMIEHRYGDAPDQLMPR